MVIGGQRWSPMVTESHCGSLRVIEGQRWSLRFTEGHLTYLFVKGCAAAEDWSRAAQRLERTPVVVKSSHPPTTNPTHADHSYNVGLPIILSNFFTTFHICFLWKILLQLFQESKIWCWGTDSGRIDRCRIRELEGTMRRQGGGPPPSSCVHSGHRWPWPLDPLLRNPPWQVVWRRCTRLSEEDLFSSKQPSPEPFTLKGRTGRTALVGGLHWLVGCTGGCRLGDNQKREEHSLHSGLGLSVFAKYTKNSQVITYPSQYPQWWSSQQMLRWNGWQTPTSLVKRWDLGVNDNLNQ